MYNDDYYTSAEYNEIDNEVNKKALNDVIKQDRGLNVITRKVFSAKKGRFVNKQINVYTSSDAGCRIRDAETGEYYPNRVGSKDEDLFYKVILATGECKSANGSSTLFYCSPQHYMNHLHTETSQDSIEIWNAKRDARLKEMSIETKPKFDSIVIH